MPTCQVLKITLIHKCFCGRVSHICCNLQYKSRHLQTEGNHSTSCNTIKTICAKHIVRSSSHYKHSLFDTPLNQNQNFSILNSIHATKSIEKTICAKLKTFTKPHYLHYSSSEIVKNALRFVYSSLPSGRNHWCPFNSRYWQYISLPASFWGQLRGVPEPVIYIRIWIFRRTDSFTTLGTQRGTSNQKCAGICGKL